MNNFSSNKEKRKNKKTYSSGMAFKIDKAAKKQAKQLKRSGFASQFDTIMLDNIDAEPASINQSNLVNRNDTVSYDTSLQRDLDFNGGYSEFGPTQMHYDVCEDFERMTSNMNPHTSKREYTQNENYTHTLALHTGEDPFYMSRSNHEPKQLFEPMRDLTYVNGAPVQTHLLEERYLPSNKNNDGDLPFENNMKVQPGVKGENLPPNAVYRTIPKSVDDLRAKNNQKVTYEADKIESGKKGDRRSILSDPTKFKKKSYRDRDIDDYLPNAAVVNKKRMTGSFKNPTTNRSISRSEVGTAYKPEKGKVQIGKYTEASKSSFASDSISRSTKDSKFNPVFQNKKAFRNVETERSTTNHDKPGAAYKSNNVGYAIDQKDVPLTTLRQLMIEGDTNIGITNQSNNNYVFSKDSVLPQNNRTSTQVNNNNGNVNSRNEQSYTIDKNDKARETVKETTINNNYCAPIQPSKQGVHYYNQNDKTRSTIKETTEINQKEGFVNVNQKTYYIGKDDIAKNTIRQTTAISNIEGTITGDNKTGYYLDKGDIAKDTLKQQTSLLNTHPIAQPDYYAPNYVDYNDKARNTIKETTEINNNVINQKSTNGSNPYLQNKDKARPTIKQQTTILKTDPLVQPEIGSVGYINNEDKPMTTMRETTENNNYSGNQHSVSGGISYFKNKDKAKPTIKQSTLQPSRDGIIGSVTKTYVKDYKEKARPTIKHSTLHSTQGGRLGRENGEIGYHRDKTEIAKQTIKETTLHGTQGGRLGREHGEIGYHRDRTDEARATIKQTTLLQNYTGPLDAEVEKHRSQEAEQNMTIDERKEILTYSRPAGAKSDLAGPILNKKTIKLKEENFIKRSNYGYDINKCNQGKLNQVFTRNKQLLNTPNYRINDDYINTLDNNPLVNDLMHQKR